MNSMSRSSAEYESPEESSWTMYLADFSNTNNYNDTIDVNDNSSILSHTNHQTSSLIPDAACSAAGRRVPGAALEHRSSNGGLSFKKRKIKRSSSGFVDRDLEDTATSPANSPKVCNLVNQFDKQKDSMGISQGIKGSASGKRNDELMGFDGRENGDNELKKKGLCLVPLSMVLHYLG
ncbi:VASCULAR-RELATED UNKNOWN PROTEIN 4 [Hibiscus trionum]|uniref:Uncharacterized protein n=1 Tax=Hibiscus trionum TaxID=183268 RepID=A0A9W7HX79_HIBTR|nr:VASCULAR-RELATED UNKNOWN PROTEIN 4 [Hibiscus trionum]